MSKAVSITTSEQKALSKIQRALCENGVEREVAKTVVTLAIEKKLGRLMIAY